MAGSGIDAGGRAARGWLAWSLGVVLALAFSIAAAAPRSLRFERIGVEQGLTQDSVHTILQDRQGFMWFGTQAGLNRFDGYKMTVFRNEPGDPASLVDNYVLASYEDAQGRLWFGTKGGLVRFDSATGKFVRYAPQDSSASASNRGVSVIVPDGHGGLWLGTGSGVRHFDPATGKFRIHRHDPRDPGSLADDRVAALAVDGSGALWVGTAAGLDRLAPGAAVFEHFRIEPAADPRRNTVLSLSMGPRDTLWIGTAAGLEAWRLDDGAPRRRHIGAAEGMPDVRITRLYHDAGANLWVGTDRDGLKWRDPASGHFVSYRNEPLDRHSLSDGHVVSIWVDRTGTLWAGTWYGGVNRADLASGGFARYTHASGQQGGIGNSKVRTIAAADNGRLWLGTSAMLTLFDPATGAARYFRHDPARPGSLPDDTVTALVNSNGRLWVGTPAGLAWRDPASGRFHPVVLGQGTNANYVQSLRAGRDGTLWIATRGGLYARAPDGRLQSWRHDPRDPDSLGEDYGYALLEDRQGIIWIGTDNGLDRFDRATGKFTHFRHDRANPDSLRHSRVYTIYESSTGQLWVGTAGGLHRVETGPDGKTRFRLFHLTSSGEALPIGALLEDATGILWVSSTVGISRLDPVTGRFKAYAAEDGLIDGSYFVGSAHAGADGRLYFGGMHGMTAFVPGEVRDNPYPPTVLVTDFLVFNRPRALGVSTHEAREVHLSWRDSVFSVEFAGLHYADPRANRYAYKLEGFDQGWVDTDSARRFATYTNLDPGTYVLRVRASNKDGVWSDMPAALTIHIAPPYWMTPWFRVLAGALALALAYSAYRLRVRALVRHKNRLELQVGARTAELVLQKDAAERRKQEVEQQKEVVEQAHRNISRLSDMGRRLTANLDSGAIMATLHEHVRALMDAPVFGVAIHKPERAVLAWAYAVRDGRCCEPSELPAADSGHLAAWCLANGRDVFIGDLDRECADYLPGAQGAAVARMAEPCPSGADAPPRSVLMVPVAVGERVLGVVTVQSFEPYAYRRVHLDMLGTLAAYVGVALDNADAYRQLKETQAQLAAHEKLASLGSLVAGVAHELNTPIGNSLLMASSLQEKTETLSARYAESALRRSDLEQWIAASQEASGLIMRSLNSAAELVNSFKQVAVDQASAQRRRFDLARACQEIAATMMKQVRMAGHTLELEVPEGIMMDSYPGPLGQVLINFINNAVLHAFAGRGGLMLLVASTPEPGRVRIEFRDDGCGIDPVHVARIFEPFFTTRMGRGGTGLGLNIAYNIVTGLLGGTIRAESQPGKGTTFTLDLPLQASAPVSPELT